MATRSSVHLLIEDLRIAMPSIERTILLTVSGMRLETDIRSAPAEFSSLPESGSRNVLLISHRVMHYRMSIYNYFHARFGELGYDFSVLADCVQAQNRTKPHFRLQVMPFNFADYRRAILEARPSVVILCLQLRDRIVWPLMHWLRWRGIPFAYWTKGRNRDTSSWLRHRLFRYMHAISDGMILYSAECRESISQRHWPKTFIANNTINFHDIPAIADSQEQIKTEFGIPFKKTVLFVGRMEVDRGRKRVDHLIDIFRELERPGVGLVLVGSGLSAELRSRLNPANTIYLGEIHDPDNIQISKLFKMADVCAIPGHVGLGLNQAFYWGLPVVTEEGDHPPEVGYLIPGRNGFMVPRNDLAALKNRILYLLDNDDIRERFSQNARQDIMERASINGMFLGFKECVDALTRRSRVANQVADVH